MSDKNPARSNMLSTSLQIKSTKGEIPADDRFCTYECIVEKQDDTEHLYCTCVCHNDLPADPTLGETARKPIPKKNE